MYAKLWQPAGEAECSPFQQGASTLACKAFGANVGLRKFWRLVEVYWFMLLVGLRPMLFYWASWYPLIAVLYVVPGIFAYGTMVVLRNPVLILTTNNLASYVFALLRVIVLQILNRLMLDYQLGRWFKIAGSENDLMVRPIDASYWLSWLAGPDFATWFAQKHLTLWRESNLQDDIPWAPSMMAHEIFEVLNGLADYGPWLYGFCLLVAILHSFGTRHARTATICCGDLGQSITRQAREIQLAVQALLQKEVGEFHEVNPKIKPVVGWGWPWQDVGIYPRVALMLLDMALDINTVVAFFSEGSTGFAGIMAFVVARSILNQMRILRPWNLQKATEQSLQSSAIFES